MTDLSTGVVFVSAVVLRDSTGAVLTVRKRGTSRFMLPGGKPEAGETAKETAVRECREELGVALDPAALKPVGVFRAPAANESGLEVEAIVFECFSSETISAGAEIADVRWLPIDGGSLPADLAPLITEQILPALARVGAKRAMPQSVAVFTGSASGARASYAEAVSELATAFSARGIDVVYGGGRVGLMGCLADAALGAGGKVVGVMPRALVDGEIAHTGLTRLDVVSDMHERKQRMATLSDAFLALPGGAGTLEEFFEVWTWQQLGIHDHPVALYDIEGFWQPLLAMVDRLVDEGFLARQYREKLIVARTPAELFGAWADWTPPAPK